MARPRNPGIRSAGQRPRGRTRPGRLAVLDQYVCAMERQLLSHEWPAHAPVIDIGLGERPDTTLELARALHAEYPDLSVVGVDVDLERVATARGLAPSTSFVCADALAERVPVALGAGRARLVRSMNVLRGLSPAQAKTGLARLGRLLAPGGVLIEGTCDRKGAVLCAHVMEAAVDGLLLRRGLLFYTDFTRGCGPWMFRDQLPRDVRHACRPGHPLHELFATWHAAFVALPGQGTSLEVRFRRAASGIPHMMPLGLRGLPGLVLWRPPFGVPEG